MSNTAKPVRVKISIGDVCVIENDKLPKHRKTSKKHVFIGKYDTNYIFLLINSENRSDYYPTYKLQKSKYDFLNKDSYVGCARGGIQELAVVNPYQYEGKLRGDDLEKIFKNLDHKDASEILYAQYKSKKEFYIATF